MTSTAPAMTLDEFITILEGHQTDDAYGMSRDAQHCPIFLAYAEAGHPIVAVSAFGIQFREEVSDTKQILLPTRNTQPWELAVITRVDMNYGEGADVDPQFVYEIAVTLRDTGRLE